MEKMMKRIENLFESEYNKNIIYNWRYQSNFSSVGATRKLWHLSVKRRVSGLQLLSVNPLAPSY